MTIRDLSFRVPPQLPVALGAVSPDPGIAGAVVWSTSIGKLLLWNGTSWGLTAGNAGVSQVNFGAGSSDTSLIVTGQTGILTSSTIVVNIAAIATADHTVEEHAVEALGVTAGNAVAGIGFTILAKTLNVALYGAYSVAWRWE